ncbi:MAG: hypothetical protein OEY43_06880 [Gammaproteobacteria bacterium]|nr:hypothetical protein [Gammaproteobacteria bacterium]
MSLKQVLQYSLVLCGIALSQHLFANQQSEFDGWMKDEIDAYGQYRDAQDKAFTEFLRLQWKEMKVYQGLQRDRAPKPVRMPVVKIPVPAVADKPGKIIGKAPPVTIMRPPLREPVEIIPAVDSIPEPVLSVMPETGKKIDNQSSLKIIFFGHALEFGYDGKSRQSLDRRPDKSSISEYWSGLSKTDYQPLLKQLQDRHVELGLNDWSYIYLVKVLSDKIYGGQQNEKILFSWFVLSKLGYQVRVGYDEQRVYLLAASKHIIYASKYFNFDGDRYYVLQLDNKITMPGNIYTYSGHYPAAAKALDMRLIRPLKTRPELQVRQLEFTFRKEKYSVSVDYDVNTVAFMNTYPQLDIGLYFETPVYKQTSSAILSQLQRLIEGLAEEEAVNLLLRFVQTAFSYQTDQQQFGQENYLFIEETVSYPYSDCEDRSILFAWLVRQLLGLDVVGLDYPGHIATAVNLKTAVKGDAVMYNGKKYIVADPTYINAGLGMSMPAYKKSTPKIIRIR